MTDCQDAARALYRALTAPDMDNIGPDGTPYAAHILVAALREAEARGLEEAGIHLEEEYSGAAQAGINWCRAQAAARRAGTEPPA